MENDVNTNSNKCYIGVMALGVVCLVVMVFAATYAYFSPRIVGEGADMRVLSGKVKLKISETKITANNLVPILDSTKATKAQKNEFTISRSDDSNLDACYQLFLVVDSIGSAMQNKWFKYELLYGENSIEGDFSNLIFEEDGTTSKIALLDNQQVTSSNPSNSYTLRVWLSYSDTEDQTSILTGEASTRQFSARIVASGQNGTCKLGD